MGSCQERFWFLCSNFVCDARLRFGQCQTNCFAISTKLTALLVTLAGDTALGLGSSQARSVSLP
eukprot:881484-Amphidinium_carterae.1